MIKYLDFITSCAGSQFQDGMLGCVPSTNLPIVVHTIIPTGQPIFLPTNEPTMPTYTPSTIVPTMPTSIPIAPSFRPSTISPTQVPSERVIVDFYTPELLNVFTFNGYSAIPSSSFFNWATIINNEAVFSRHANGAIPYLKLPHAVTSTAMILTVEVWIYSL